MHLSALHLYPVKSCRGLSVESAEVDKYGLIDDRRFMVVHETDGIFLTQRTHPRMALIETALTAEGLVLWSSGHGSATVARQLATEPKIRSVTVWKNTVNGDDCGDEVAVWLSRFLELPLRLVKMGRTFHRPVKPEKAKPGDEVSFADAYPFLIITEASLTDLNTRLAEPLPMNRFRPNLVVAGAEPYAEDSWQHLRIGNLSFRNGGPCARCPVTATDQLTAVRGKEPLKTFATYRRDPAEPTKVNFGANLIHETKSGVIRVGDRVTVEQDHTP